jgi:hypothetical protein
MKTLGKSILSILCFLVVTICGFYTGMIAASAAGMPPSDFSLEPLFHGSIGALAGAIAFIIIMLVFLNIPKSIFTLVLGFATFAGLIASPIAGVISYKQFITR